MIIKKNYNNMVNRFAKNIFYTHTETTIYNNSHIEIQNCSKILDYSDCYLKVKTAGVNLQIWGENLKISDYNTSGIVVDGKILSIEFE